MRLLRLFSVSFADGRVGIGLLLLRVAVGLAAVVQGGICLADRSRQPLLMWAIGLLAIACGISLLIGFLTPFACFVVNLGGICIMLSWFAEPVLRSFGNGLSLFFVVITSSALVLLGPGAFSFDARLFGRREIIIPHAPRQPKS